MPSSLIDQKREYFARAKLNLRAAGLLVKKLPKTLLEQYADYRDTNQLPADTPLKNTMLLLNNLGLVDGVTDWARRGVDEQYLKEVLEGAPFSKSASFACMIKNSPDATLAGFVCYGMFNPVRKTAEDDYKIDFTNAALNGQADDGRVAEIEIVITNPAIAHVGTHLFEYALWDLMARKKGGQSRYKHILLFTDQAAMKKICQHYGFTSNPVSYTNNDPDGNVLPTRIAPRLPCYVLDTADIAKAQKRTEERPGSINTELCPPKADSRKLRYWAACQGGSRQ